MKVCILFYNLGGYHLARLAAANEVCVERGWEFSAIEVVGGTAEHPWGEMKRPDYVKTLMPFRDDDHPTVGDPKILKQALNEISPNVLAIPGWGYDFSRLAIGWGREHKCRLILMSESKRDDAPRNFFKEKIKKHLWVNKFDAALVGGQKHADYLVELGMPREKIFTGYDVVDNAYFKSGVQRVRENWARGENRSSTIPTNKYFLSANRFIERKNLPRLIKSYSAVVSGGEMNEDWDLVLLGSGSPAQTQVVKNAIESSGLSNRVHLPGFIEYEEMCEWYAGASVFVHPALSEQWGLVVNEAMATGLPILLSNTCGCHPELLNEGENGLSFSPNDSGDLSRQMIRIANMDLAKMGLASLAKIQKEFPASSFGAGIVNAINAIVPE